jgi:glutamine synthetase
MTEGTPPAAAPDGILPAMDTHDGDEVARRLADAGVRLVVMTMVDNGGVTRVKLVPLGRLARVARAGVGMSDVWAVSGVDDHFAFSHAPHFDTPSGDMRLLPVLDAVRPLAAAPGYAWAPVTQHDQELRPLDVCQRSALARVAAAGAARGVEVRATFELEFTLLTSDGRPAHDGPGYSPRALLPLEAFAVDLTDALERQGISVDQLHPEYAPGQFEVSVGAVGPVAAADQLVLMRITVRQVAARHGLGVSFSPVVLAGAVGNGCHLHLSAWRDGHNLMTGGDAHGALTADGAAFLAGILEELPAVTCVVAPSAASYLRLLPGHWAGAWTAWGIENREASLRLIPGSRTTRGSSANVELKVVDGAANPYLAMLAAVATGLDGIERRLELRAPVQADPAQLSPDEREQVGARRLPADLPEAIDALSASARLRTAFGDRLFDSFVAVRRMEAETFAGADAESLVAAHRDAY